jgi:hypothetical protein
MPREVKEYSCLLISPTDVQNEREALTDLVNRWNAQIGKALSCRIDLVKWESHATPDLSGPPQEVIDRQLVDSCELGIAIFWYRLGTPTAKHPSGSIEEIDNLVKRGARVLVYFNNSPIPQEALKDDQFEKLREARRRFEKNGLVDSYLDISQLKEKVQLHLTSVITDFLSKDRVDIGSPPPAKSNILTAPIPDVRVKVQAGFVMDPWGNTIDLIIITVQNHSPNPVFLGNVYLKTNGDKIFIQGMDSVTREYQHRRKLEAGESFDFHIEKKNLADQADPYDLVCAAVKDTVDRVYESSPADFRKLIQGLFPKNKS